MSDDEQHWWQVTRTWYVKATKVVEAIDKTRPQVPPDGEEHQDIRARVLPDRPPPPVETEQPKDRHDAKEWTYDQPRDVLDLAWDRYMELSLVPTATGAPGMVHLAMNNVEPPDLSRLFDIAITAYRRATEPPLTDHEELLEDIRRRGNVEAGLADLQTSEE